MRETSFTPAEIETLAKAGIRTCRVRCGLWRVLRCNGSESTVLCNCCGQDLLDAHELQLSALLDKGVKVSLGAWMRASHQKMRC